MRNKWIIALVVAMLVGLFPSSVNATSYALSAPASLSAKSYNETTIKLTWKKVTGATGYYVYRYNSESELYEKIKSTKKTSYSDTDRELFMDYFYYVVPYTTRNGKTVVGKKSKTVKGYTLPNAPTVKISMPETDKIKLSLSSDHEDTEFIIYRSTSKTKGYVDVAHTKNTTWIDEQVTYGKTYYYKAKQVLTQEEVSRSSYFSSIISKTVILSTPSLYASYRVNKLEGKGTLSLSSSEVSLATGYELYEKVGSGSYQLILDTSEPFQLDTYLYNTKHTYRIRVYATVNGQKVYSNYCASRTFENEYTFYHQHDKRWEYKRYSSSGWGANPLGWIGCGIMDIAMAMTDIYNETPHTSKKRIYPTTIASWLYKNTSQFNKHWGGISGKGIELAVKHFGFQYEGLNTKEDIIRALGEGKYVVMIYQKTGYAHAVLLREYNPANGKVYVQDSNMRNNYWASLSYFTNRPSKYKEDYNNGYKYHAIY